MERISIYFTDVNVSRFEDMIKLSIVNYEQILYEQQRLLICA